MRLTLWSVITKYYFQTSHKKHKKEKVKEKETEDVPFDGMSPIAHPLADKKLSKKLHKTVKRGNYLLGCRKYVY